MIGTGAPPCRSSRSELAATGRFLRSGIEFTNGEENSSRVPWPVLSGLGRIVTQTVFFVSLSNEFSTESRGALRLQGSELPRVLRGFVGPAVGT